MPKSHLRYVCRQCGSESPRWLGRCPDCEAWNSFEEDVRPAERPGALRARAAGPHQPSASPEPVTRVRAAASERQSTGIGELDRVLGGGLVPGALVLVGGDPGIGKSTLMTQVAHCVAAEGPDRSVLYVSGEESAEQIRLRAARLGALTDRFLVLAETDVNAVAHHIAATAPTVVIVDSIQTTYDPGLESAPGTVTQVRSAAASLGHLAKGGGPPVFIVGHVTKEGTLAGPRVLEHMVDTVLYFEGDRHMAYRILRAVKNRFGSTDEIGIFEMHETGLAEVANPSAALLAERTAGDPGSVVTSTLEGSRPLLVEVQALVSRSYMANPRRTSTGVEMNRLGMLLAVLEKRVGLRLGEQDVFVNVAGGLRIVEPAADLATALAVASSFREQAVDPGMVAIGEVGLAGEVRAVAQAEKRLREAARMGFARALVAAHGAPRVQGIEAVRVGTLIDAIQAAFLPPRH